MNKEGGINMMELAQKLWNNKWLIFKISIIGLIFSIIVAFSIPKEYTSSVILISESGKASGGGNMGALASMAGINLKGNSNDDVFSAELYPNVLESTPFIKGLLSIDVSDPEQDIQTSLYNYIENGQKTPWWMFFLKIPKILQNTIFYQGNMDSTTLNKYVISEREMLIIKHLRKSCSIKTDKKTRITTLNVTSQSPIISAYIADTLTSYLQMYIIEQRTKKAKTDLLNSEKLHKQAKSDYYNSQSKLAEFVDRNQNISQAKHIINKERLQNEANLAYSIYNQMAQQVQMDKMKVQDNTPVFTIIQPAVKPLQPSSVSKKTVILIMTFLCIFIASVFVLRKDILAFVLPLKNK